MVIVDYPSTGWWNCLNFLERSCKETIPSCYTNIPFRQGN
jgi:hypothetical protein